MVIRSMGVRATAVAAGILTFGAFAGSPVTVTSPSGAGVRVAEGQDFATYDLGNPWDMSDTEDVNLFRSGQITNESISGGIYRGTTTGGDAGFYLLDPGLRNAVRSLDKGERFPIDPGVYRYLTMRVRYSRDGGTLANNQNPSILWFQDSSSISEGTIGSSKFGSVPPEQWSIVTFDLYDADQSVPSQNRFQNMPQVRGLRVDPNAGGNAANVTFEIDWIRLTAEPSASTRANVAWTGGTAPFTVSVDYSGGGTLDLETGISGSSADVDFSRLPPADYVVRVTGGSSDTSDGPVLVNQAPIFNFLQPDVRGDEANSYAMVQAGNPWGPMDAGDIEVASDISNISYSSPQGSFTGTATTSDPRILLNTPVDIDTERYRMLCYTMELMTGGGGPTGSVARLLYGNNLPTLSTSEDVLVEVGLNEYCIGDLRDVPIDGGGPSDWFGALAHLRFDPDEEDPPTLIRLDEVLLAPFDTANRQFAFSWTDVDSDDSASVDLYLDEDQTPLNGNETLITSGLSEDDASDAFVWTAPGSVGDDVYDVLAVADDGLNETYRYATGPLLVGSGSAISLAVTQPDGVDDTVAPGPDAASDRLGNAWDMTESSDVRLAANFSGVTFNGGVFSGTSTNNDPAVVLLNADDGVRLNTADYRYLTAKMRVSGAAGPHFTAVLFFSDDTTIGTATGLVPENGWQIVTIDMINDLDGNSPVTWNGVGSIEQLRFDPTNRNGTLVEIDWVTLTPTPTAATEYSIQWTANGLTPSTTFDVFWVDSDGARVEIASNLASDQRQLTGNVARFSRGSYGAEVIATPGPTAISPGSLIVGSDFVFGNGFE